MYFGRGKNKVQSPYLVRDMYKEYIADKDENSPYHITYKQFSNIVRKYYNDISEYILSGGVYTLPFRMGSMLIVKYRPKQRTATNTPIDWENTVKYGKVIRFTNDHSNYFKFMYNWNRFTCHVANKTLYRFIPTRAVKRTLAAKIKAGNNDFFEL